MTDIEPPTDDLRALFAAERDVSAVERTAIRGKLAASIAAPAPAAAAIATTKLAWVAAALIATAAGIWWLTHRDKPAPIAPPPTPVLVAPSPEPTISTTAPEPAVAAPEPVAPATAPAKPQPSQADLLAKAWQAVDHHDPKRALALVELDAKLHPKGALAEERDALHVHALVVLGDYNTARDLANTFLARYPQSVHRTRVKRAFAGPR